jgi:hypothetical protein
MKEVYDAAHPRAEVSTIPHPAQAQNTTGPSYYPAKAG